jgi:septal ring factor EnvC (AmiA/AmiB activator)
MFAGFPQSSASTSSTFAGLSQTAVSSEAAAAVADRNSAAALVQTATERLETALAHRRRTKAALDVAISEDTAARAKEEAASRLLQDIQSCYAQAARRVARADAEQAKQYQEALSASSTCRIPLPAALHNSPTAMSPRRSRAPSGIVMRKRKSTASGIGRPADRTHPFFGVTSGEKRPSLLALHVVRRLEGDDNVVINATTTS